MAQPVYGTPWQTLNQPVSEEELAGVDRYWRAANYLSVGQIYLRSNPLMKEGFSREDVKHRLVGHWGTTPGLNFLFGHVSSSVASPIQAEFLPTTHLRLQAPSTRAASWATPCPTHTALSWTTHPCWQLLLSATASQRLAHLQLLGRPTSSWTR